MADSLRVLYVDDDPALLEIGKLFLEESGRFTVDIITSASAALNHLNATKFDAIISDYQMPGMDGIQFLKSVRASGNAIPFILFTGRGREEIVIQALNEGANFYLQKGGEPEAQFAELVHKIQIAVEHHHAAEKIQALNRLYSVLSATNKAIFRIQTKEAFFSEICRILVETGGFRMAWIGLAKPEQKIIRPVASAGHVEGYLDTINISTEDVPQGRGPTGTAFREGKYFWSNDITQDPRMEPWRENALKRGYLANAAFAFALGTKNAGVLSVYAPVTGFFNGPIIELLEELAVDISFYLGAIDEQNERILAINAHRVSEERFHGLFDTINSGVAIYEVRNEGKSGKDYIIKDFNKIALEIEGKKKDEVIGKSLFDLRPTIDEYGLIPVFQQVWKTGVPAYFPQKIYIDEKYSSWYENRVFRLQNGEIVAVYDDVTGRRRAEEALRESEVRFRTLFQDAAEAHLLLVNGIHTDCNQALLTLMRCTREEIIGHSPIELSPEFQPDGMLSEEKAAVFIREVFETGSKRFEWMHRRPDGTCFWAEVVATSLIIDGKPTLFGSWRDITERKQAEEALQENEGRVRKKLESLLSPGGDIGVLDLGDIIDPQVLKRLMEDFTRVTGMGMAILDTKGTVLVATGWQEICTKFHRVNPVTAGFCTESDLHLAKNMKQGEYVAYHCRNHLWDVVTPLYIGSKHMGNIFTGQFFYDDDIVDEPVFIRQAEKYGFDRDAYLAALHRVPKFSRQKISDLMDYLVKLADFISLLSYRNLELARTVTERDALLTSLQKSEGKFRTLVENIPQKIFLKDLDSRYVTVNENFARDLGVSPEEMAGKTDSDLFPAEFAASYRAGDIRVLETGKTDELEERYLLDGKETWVHTIKTVVKDEDGAVAGLLGVFWDVTERKRVEEALRESEEHMKESQRVGHLGSWDLNIVTGELQWSDECFRIYGFSPQEFVPTYEKFRNIVHPEDLGFVQEQVDAALNNKKHYDVDFRFVRPDGETRWIHCEGDVTWDENGRPLRFFGIQIDITGRKLAEEALRESEEKYRILLDESLDPVFSFYPDGTYRYVNRAFATGVGKPADQIIGKKIWDVFDKEEAEKRFSALRTVFATGDEKVIEVRVPRPGGDRYYVTTIVPVKNENGAVVSAICSSKDITPRMQAEEALRQANKKLNLLSSITRHDINNQLLALNGFLNLLHNKARDPALEEYFTRITKASERISTMIQFTREYEEIGVHAPAWQEARTYVDFAAKDAPLGTIMVKNEIPAGSELLADPLVVKVFYNLMDNAARYGKKITTIGFSVLESGDDHIIVCEDDGEGIPADEKEKIFERGFGKTTGMGLALSREILEITGITIRETGEPGRGARFEMVVPKGAWRLRDQDRGGD